MDESSSRFKEYFTRPENLTNFIAIVVAILLGYRGIKSGSVEEYLQAMIAVLGILAFAQLVSGYTTIKRQGKLNHKISNLSDSIKGVERIEKDIKDLLKIRQSEFITDINVIWSKAIDMVESVGEGGQIYDSTSIKNSNKYEEAIKKKYFQGVEITRLICTEESNTSLNNFIIPPTSYDSISSKGTIALYHLPYSLPFDVLITHTGTVIQAIIGFKTTKPKSIKYTSSLYIMNNEFAKEIRSIYYNVLLFEANIHHKSFKKNKQILCNICNEIMSQQNIEE